MKAPSYTLRQQADELGLRGREQVEYVAKLRRAGKPKEMTGLMDYRIEVLRACYDTINKLAIAEEAAAAKESEMDTKPSIQEPEVELDEWGDPIERK